MLNQFLLVLFLGVAGEDGHAAFVVGVDEVHGFLTLGGDGHTAADEVGLVLLEGIEQGGEVHEGVFHLHVELIGHAVDDFDIQTEKLVVGLVDHGHLGGVSGIADGAGAAVVVLLVLPLGDVAVRVDGFAPFLFELLEFAALLELLDDRTDAGIERVALAGGEGIAVICVGEGYIELLWVVGRPEVGDGFVLEHSIDFALTEGLDELLGVVVGAELNDAGLQGTEHFLEHTAREEARALACEVGKLVDFGVLSLGRGIGALAVAAAQAGEGGKPQQNRGEKRFNF